MKIENKRKLPNEIEESTENDGGNIEICKNHPMADKYIVKDWGNIGNIQNPPNTGEI